LDVKPDKPLCMNFWYHLNGDTYLKSTGTLNILTRPINISVTEPNELRWTLAGEKGDFWFNAKLPLKSNIPFYVIIEGLCLKIKANNFYLAFFL
jgi:hypothetical protein